MPDLITLAIPAFFVLLFAEAVAGAMMTPAVRMPDIDSIFEGSHEN